MHTFAIKNRFSKLSVAYFLHTLYIRTYQQPTADAPTVRLVTLHIIANCAVIIIFQEETES